MKRRNYSKMAVLFIGLFLLVSTVSLCTDARGDITRSSAPSVVEEFSPAGTPHDAIWIIGNDELHAQAALESWPGNGTAESPYLITGYYFDQWTQPLRMWDIDIHWRFIGNEIDGNSTVQCGTWIVNCTNGAIVENNIHRRHAAMYLEDLSHFNVSNNHIYDNRWNGIEILGYCNDSYISNNIIHDNVASGIRISQPKNTEIAGNVIENCGNSGIQFMGLSFDTIIRDNNITGISGAGIQMGTSTGVLIQENNVVNASDEGMYLINGMNLQIKANMISHSGGDGISLASCGMAEIADNSISFSVENGLRDSSSENSTYLRNEFTANGLYGLVFGDTCSNATASWNCFIDSGNEPQVCDDGQDNTFIYNYYDEWTSPDTNSDSIVDNPYSIDGTTGNGDAFPLADPNAIPPAAESTTSTTDGSSDLPMEMLMIAGGGVVVVLLVVFILRRRWN
jgi:parallel beta-helix repeat protein